MIRDDILEKINNYVNNLNKDVSSNLIDQLSEYLRREKITLTDVEIFMLLDNNKNISDTIKINDNQSNDNFILSLKRCHTMLVEDYKKIEAIRMYRFYRQSYDGTYHSFYGNLPILSNSMQIMLLRKAQNGDSDAKDLLVKTNLRLVCSIADDFSKKGLFIEDLIQEGCFGLMNAIDKYDLLKGQSILFSSFAYKCIYNQIIVFINRNTHLIRIPENTRIMLSKIYKVRKLLEKELSRIPTVDEIAKEIELPVEKVVNLLKSRKFIISMDEELKGIGVKDNSLKVKDNKCISDDSFSEEMNRSLLKYDVERLFKDSHLTEREIEILKLRFGFYNDTVYSVREIGVMYNISGEYVRQIELSALKKIIKSAGINEFALYSDDYEGALERLEALRLAYADKKNGQYSIDKIIKKYLK